MAELITGERMDKGQIVKLAAAEAIKVTTEIWEKHWKEGERLYGTECQDSAYGKRKKTIIDD